MVANEGDTITMQGEVTIVHDDGPCRCACMAMISRSRQPASI